MKTPDPQLRQELDAFVKKFDEARNNNDAAAMAALFTEDAILVGRTQGRFTVGMPSRSIKQTCSSNFISATV
jgi:ketosteroid isomerase-like protein